MPSTIQSYCTDQIHGFNVQINSNELSYFRLKTKVELSYCQQLRMAHHNENLLGIEPIEERLVRKFRWGILPKWWQRHPKFNGIPIYFINANKLKLPSYQNSRFALVPIKNIVLKDASVFKQIWPKDGQQQIWCLGIVNEDHHESNVALLQKTNLQLLTLEEIGVTQFYRSKPFGKTLIHLIRENLARQIESAFLDTVLPLEQPY